MLPDTFSAPIPSVLRGFPDAHPATKIGNEDQFIGIARPALRWMGPGLARRGRLPFAAAFGGGEKLQAPLIIGGHCAPLRRVRHERRNDAAGSRRHCGAKPYSTRKWASDTIFLLNHTRRRRLWFSVGGETRATIVKEEFAPQRAIFCKRFVLPK